MISIRREFILIALIISVIISLLVGWVIIAKPYLDNIFNRPGFKDGLKPGTRHIELMKWNQGNYTIPTGHSMVIELTDDGIEVIYKIDNLSNQEENENIIDLAIVAADLNSIGDPGSILWKWSNSQEGNTPEDLAKSDLSYHKKFYIDGKHIEGLSQYYISAYFKGELVYQYKVITISNGEQKGRKVWYLITRKFGL